MLLALRAGREARRWLDYELARDLVAEENAGGRFQVGTEEGGQG